MSEQDKRIQNLYEIQVYLFEYEEVEKEYSENQKKYVQILKLLARNKGLDFISQQLNDPDITFYETLERWNPVLTILISDALFEMEPDKNTGCFLKKIGNDRIRIS